MEEEMMELNFEELEGIAGGRAMNQEEKETLIAF